ncbi:hypothetical protein HDU93_007150 [Gonapodya sp. JEL0774]|nr:hypothetical protein HDU93_007150 [Gonapodya sp. JEL0774]
MTAAKPVMKELAGLFPRLVLLPGFAGSGGPADDDGGHHPPHSHSHSHSRKENPRHAGLTDPPDSTSTPRPRSFADLLVIATFQKAQNDLTGTGPEVDRERDVFLRNVSFWLRDR